MPVYGHSVIAFATEIAAVVAWRSRHASEFPADIVLYTWVLSNPAQSVMQLAMF
jgi:hypothetical protein